MRYELGRSILYLFSAKRLFLLIVWTNFFRLSPASHTYSCLGLPYLLLYTHLIVHNSFLRTLTFPQKYYIERYFRTKNKLKFNL